MNGRIQRHEPLAMSIRHCHTCIRYFSINRIKELRLVVYARLQPIHRIRITPGIWQVRQAQLARDARGIRRIVIFRSVVRAIPGISAGWLMDGLWNMGWFTLVWSRSEACPGRRSGSFRDVVERAP